MSASEIMPEFNQFRKEKYRSFCFANRFNRPSMEFPIIETSSTVVLSVVHRK